MTFEPANTLAPFLATSTFFPDNFDEFRVKFLEIYRDLANTVNTRENGIFDLTEFITGEQWFTSGDPLVKRSNFRLCFEIGAIAVGATSTTPHGITELSEFSRIFGTCVTDVVDYRPIPYVSATVMTNQIQITIDPTNIVIVNGATAPNITSAIVVLEYFKI